MSELIVAEKIICCWNSENLCLVLSNVF